MKSRTNRRDFLKQSALAAAFAAFSPAISPLHARSGGRVERENFERDTSFCWDEDEWARGAYSILKPGQMFSLLPHIARPEGRVHFAGEHASAWPAWQQGALASGNRVAREINQAP